MRKDLSVGQEGKQGNLTIDPVRVEVAECGILHGAGTAASSQACLSLRVLGVELDPLASFLAFALALRAAQRSNSSRDMSP